MKNGTNFHPGLEGVIAAETNLSNVDGLVGKLIIGGFPVTELAEKAQFEETVYLLWHARLPNQAELTAFRAGLARQRQLPQATHELLRAAAASGSSAMEALRIGVGTVDLDVTETDQLPLVLLARLPTLVAAYWRYQQGEPAVAPDETLGHAANFLYMLSGQRPSPARTRGLETYLNTVVDHGLNASTFAARVIIATGSDLVSAITGAVGALKGPLHGGAPGPALDTVFEISSSENAESVLAAKLARGERLMGFGHRVYKVRDPRAEVLATAAEKMYAADGDMGLYRLAKEVETTAVALLAAHKPGRNLQTNVEFYTALLLHGLDLDTELFTPTFALSRTAGWIAHCFEQKAYGRLIRPKARYVGRADATWLPLEQRPEVSAN